MGPRGRFHQAHPGRHRRRPDAGSALAAALLFAAFVAAILATYLRVATTALSNANRTFYADACAELAECGVEEAMAAFYRVSKGESLNAAWHGWHRDGIVATETFTGFTPGPNASGVVRVWVQHFALGGTPLIVARATVTPPQGPPIEKYLEVTGKARGLFSKALIAQDRILWSGTTTVDSWNSDPDGDPSTPPIPYSSGVRQSHGSIAAMGKKNGDVSIGLGRVYGTIATGGGSVSYTNGAIVSDRFDGTGVDPRLISTDFGATFPLIEAPMPNVTNMLTTNVTVNTTFPRPGDRINADGRYYYTFAMGAGIVFSGGAGLNIDGNCVLILNNHNGASSIVTSGGSAITVQPGASLQIYTNGHITASGDAFINRNGQPAKALVFGTNPQKGKQQVTVSGVGGGGAGFYMPNANLTLSGSGTINGSFIAHTITMSGSAEIHYDEALATVGQGTGILVTKWKQLNTAVERAAYATQLSF
jgi:hypothetical protein